MSSKVVLCFSAVVSGLPQYHLALIAAGKYQAMLS